ncbi:putative protein FAM172B [Hypanus sabinus]|uniref:putative protein FAM172B n=1 Tax=Hypanus sabinus TaxID=79690 RepID=UPI0028C39BCB|nr:putative protein FAM172B [Hypanus sabinus]
MHHNLIKSRDRVTHDSVLFQKMEERMILTQLENTKRLKEFNYIFNEKGQLRHIETNQPFVSKQYNNAMNLDHEWYTAFGRTLAEYIYELLEKGCGLKRLYVPEDAAEDEPKSFCFTSEGALNAPSKLIVFVQDRGVMRAGTWSQQLVVHDCLDTGTQIPFIERALSEQYEVMVLNPNDNFLAIEMGHSADAQSEHKVEKPKRGVESHEQHMSYIWDHFLSKCAPMSVAFVVHGYGGLAFMSLLTERAEVMNKVYTVAFINSNHDVDHQNVGPTERDWIAKNCRKWLLSDKPLDKPVSSMRKDCPQVSAGTENHDLAPATCLHPIFKYLKKVSNTQKTNQFTRSPIVTRRSSKEKLKRTADSN